MDRAVKQPTAQEIQSALETATFYARPGAPTELVFERDVRLLAECFLALYEYRARGGELPPQGPISEALKYRAHSLIQEFGADGVILSVSVRGRGICAFAGHKPALLAALENFDDLAQHVRSAKELPSA